MMAKIIVMENPREDGKCGACNWENSLLYAFAGHESDISEVGLCADCFLSFLMDSEAEVSI